MNAEMRIYTYIFKTLSDRTRLRILRLLTEAKGGLCVCEIMDSLNEAQYNVSRHLRELEKAGLVTESKEGRWVSYSLARTKDQFQKLVLRAISSIPRGMFDLDEVRMKKRLALRESGRCVVGMKSREWRKIISQLRSRAQLSRALLR